MTTLSERLTPTITMWQVELANGEIDYWIEGVDQPHHSKGRMYVPAISVTYDEHDVTVATADGALVRVPAHAVKRVITIDNTGQ